MNHNSGTMPSEPSVSPITARNKLMSPLLQLTGELRNRIYE